MNKKLLFIIVVFILLITTFIYYTSNKKQITVVAIANYGPHASLNNAIDGFKEYMRSAGFIESENIQYEISDVGFDASLIPQMITNIKGKSPEVIITMTTPVAQSAKAKIKQVPLVYSVVTDPIEAGLIKNLHEPDGNMTGSSDRQDLESFLSFAKSILPKCNRVGLLYAISESNDIALVNMMRASAAKLGMEVVAVPIEQVRDVSIRMQQFKGKVDFIYVGTSGPIQPTLAVIAAEARKMSIPVFNVEAQAVRDGLAVASYGVDYEAVGKNVGRLVAALLNGAKIDKLAPLYPKSSDHHGVINKKLAKVYSMKIPADTEIVG